jgi:hypothetical protein
LQVNFFNLLISFSIEGGVVKNKKKFGLAFFVLLTALLFFAGCPADEGNGNGQYTLTVAVGSGASGTPATGSYPYAENSIVNYSYSLQPGYTNLAVTLDGATVGASGVITVTGNHVLNVTAQQIDIRARWTGRFYYGISDTFFRVDFSGNLDSGTCGGLFDFVSIGGAGTWTLAGTQIDFTLEYPAPINTTLTCQGSLSDANNMSGTWIYTPPGITGNWSLERQ